MNDGRNTIEPLQGDAAMQTPPSTLPAQEPATIDYTELPDSSLDSPIAREWNLYRREIGRLLADGQENRCVLIKDDCIIGIWNTEDDARAVALQRFMMQPCLIQQVRRREPIVRMSSRFWRCQG
jgi:hypothetical protein